MLTAAKYLRKALTVNETSGRRGRTVFWTCWYSLNVSIQWLGVTPRDIWPTMTKFSIHSIYITCSNTYLAHNDKEVKIRARESRETAKSVVKVNNDKQKCILRNGRLSKC